MSAETFVRRTRIDAPPAAVTAGPGACWLVDRIVYAPPFGALGRWLGGRFVGERLERMFAYRHEVTRAAFAGWRAARWIVAAGVL
ncbi:MAG TPA: hypothetical protein VFC23_09415 [Thermoanaerobaculia bacterium]|nr:hypothetical protein [Thermoanaerobaculia bacterium]